MKQKKKKKTYIKDGTHVIWELTVETRCHIQHFLWWNSILFVVWRLL